MTEQFQREDRYFVIKRKHLPNNGEGFVEWLERRGIELVPLAVVVEGDWPEYEPVWQMIEARVTGQAAIDTTSESLARMVLDICPSGSPTAPDGKVQAFYIRMGELRALKALANQVLSPSQKGGAA